MAETDRSDREAQERAWSRLMAAAQDGDRAAYGRLLTEITPFVRVLCRRRLADPHACEDAVQDVLLCVHRVRQTYDPRRPFTPWLAAITARRTIDAVRRRSRVAAMERSDQAAYETFADPRANKVLEAGEDQETAAALLERLPPGQRQALELVKLKELSLAEAAAISGQSVGALKVNVHRAIKALRLRLGGGGP